MPEGKGKRPAAKAIADQQMIFATELGAACRRLAEKLADLQRAQSPYLFVDSLGEAIHDVVVLAVARTDKSDQNPGGYY